MSIGYDERLEFAVLHQKTNKACEIAVTSDNNRLIVRIVVNHRLQDEFRITIPLYPSISATERRFEHYDKTLFSK